MGTNATEPSGVLALQGVTVIDLTQVLAGPFATMTLGDLGATVIKIEAKGRGDRSRDIDPYPEYFDTVNRNKQSITLDLKSNEGQAVAKSLVRDADVFIESTKPGRIEDYGLGYQMLTDENPDLIYCSISGFGRDSPYEDVAAWDMLIQAMSGIMSVTGTPDGPPLWSGLASGDLIAGSYAVQSILTALFARERGLLDSEWIEVPMLDAAVSWLTVRAGFTFGTGDAFPRLGTHHPQITPFGVFDCADTKIVIAAGTDSLWEDLCDALDITEIGAEPRFSTITSRVEHRAELRDLLDSILEEKPAREWIELFHEYGIPAGPIHDTLSVWDDPHVQGNQLKRVMERAGRKNATVIDHPIHYQALTRSLSQPPEELGESTDEVLSQYGYSSGEIERLRDHDVID